MKEKNSNKNSLFHKALSILMSISMVSSIIIGSITTLFADIKSASAYNLNKNSITENLEVAAFIHAVQIQDEHISVEIPDDSLPTHVWDKYIGDLDMFVYGLIISEYQNYYEVFNGMISLPDGSEIYGIGYTDFDSYFESDEGFGFFPAGFIPLIGESKVPEDLIENGLEIVDIDQMEIGISFVLSYDTGQFLRHCIIWDQYLKYGIDENGRITYTAEDYVRGDCNEELGALYSYDERRFVFDPDVGKGYRYITGQSLYTPIDYASLEAEVNRILEEQDFNFSEVEVRTAVYTAQEAYTNYLLSLQEESFMGYPVKDLIVLAEQLDPMELIRFTPEGHVIVNIADDIPDTADALTKWLTSFRIGITLACTGVSIIIPAFAPFAGAISMASCNVFSQILDENRYLSDINWGKVAISAVTGAMLAWAIPTMSGGVTKDLMLHGASEAAAKLAGYSLQGISSGVIHGISDSVSAMMDGKNLGDAWDTFLISAAQTAAISLAFSGAFEVLNPLMDKVSGKISDVLKKEINEKPNGWLSKAVNKIGKLDIHQIHLDNEKLDRFLTPRSVYESAKTATQELKAYSSYLDEELRNLPGKHNKNFKIFDMDGKSITKAEIQKDNMNFVIRPSEECDEKILQAFSELNIKEIPVVDGIPDFEGISVFSFKLDTPLTANRDVNYDNISKQLAKIWKEDNSKMPQIIKQFFTDDELANLTDYSEKIYDIVRTVKLTYHEGADGKVQIVNTFLHNKIGHAGGVFLAKMRETITVGVDYLKWILYGIEPVAIETVVS